MIKSNCMNQFKLIRFFLVSLFFISVSLYSYGQRLTLDELLKFNSLDVIGIKKSLKAKGYTLIKIDQQVHGNLAYHWESKDQSDFTKIKSIMFRVLDLDEEMTTLSYSFYSEEEYKSFENEVKKKGFKFLKTTDASFTSYVEYKKGKIGVTLYKEQGGQSYTVAVSD